MSASTMATSETRAHKHIPAWRRLGLKLKNAKDEPEETVLKSNMTTHNTEHSLKRKVPIEILSQQPMPATEGQIKKKRKIKSTLFDNESNTSVTLSADSADYTIQLPVTPSLQKRKSVTFAPDAKEEDGDSVKQIYKTWIASQRASDPDFDASNLSPALKSMIPAAVTAPLEVPSTSAADTTPPTSGRLVAPKKKKNKSKITHQASQDPQTSTLVILDGDSKYIHPALTYIHNHRRSPNTWKFNKAHQNYLLKHLFRLSHVPSNYDPALASYLKGLASENTKARIRREALDIRKEDEKWLASPIPESESAEKEGKDTDTTMETGIKRETPEQNLARRLRDYNNAVENMKQILQSKEESREEREWILGDGRKEWEERLAKRRRAEVVLWGVGEIGAKVTQELDKVAKPIPAVRPLEKQPEFRQQMGPKRIKFGEEAYTTTGANATAPMKQPLSTATPTDNGQDGKKKRKRKRTNKDRLGAIPDDESSSSSDSGSDEEERKRMAQKKELRERLAAQKRELEKARREVEELSDKTSSDGGENEERLEAGMDATSSSSGGSGSGSGSESDGESRSDSGDESD